ncbi:MAG: hypothetical protein JXR76_30710 [Deltaproteobacteria bacterium]|nr:hypothetical protein [Deltaproteobacteria bacterium]
MTVQSDKEGRPVKEILGEVVERDYEYNADGLLTRQHVYTSSFELAERKYGYAPVGNLVSRTDSKKGVDPRLWQSENERGQKVEMVYDAQGRIRPVNTRARKFF